MYKSETFSTESATNASSSQHPEIERTYMSSDTSTMLVKKKKTNTKALVKRLLGVVADLSSKVDRVLQKKDEPDTGFGEEGEEMINEEEEETYYHDAIHTKIEENHQNKEKKAVESPGKANEDIVNEESNDVSNHLLLDSVHAANIWKVDIYDSARSMNFFSKYFTGGEFTSFGDSIISELDVIEY
ncbi:unnamed protein product [Lactuca virosa]|uniref:Uncharacterized protein n=1 Tax=Lactuca virosa TaxID=75947 RepID=A0AAU9LHP2_9ASTR|nr:unnamed protein product [Lactuca virosa]